MARAPDWPINAAAAGIVSDIYLARVELWRCGHDSLLTAGNPADTSAGVKVIKGSSMLASVTAPRPILVAIPIGIPNQAMPPHRNALTLVCGVLAMARCQYAWSLNTVPMG